MSKNSLDLQACKQFPASNQLIVRHLSCWRGYRHLLTNLSFSLKSGEILALAGHNGVGKSSLLAILAGLLDAYSGHISFQNRNLLKSDVFWLGVTLPFYPTINLYDNLFFWASLNDRCHSDIEQVLNIWQLDLQQHLPFNQLSRGQQQRAHLSRLAFDSCPIWLLDEPLTGLDQQSMHIFYTIVNDFLQRGGLIVMTPPKDDWITQTIDLNTYAGHQPHDTIITENQHWVDSVK